jgi:hypothetical protein
MAARRRLTAGAAGLCAVALAGCGTQPPDLFVVQRTGPDPNADVRMVIDDGGNVTCNTAPDRVLEADQLLEARALARDLTELSYLNLDLPPRPGSDLRYRVDLPSGVISYADNSAERPPALNRLTAFTATVTEDVCRIER